MTKQRQKASASRISKKRGVILGAFAAIAATVSILGYYSAIPVNGTSPVFGLPSNHFLKATYSPGNGYVFISQSSGAAKGMRSNGGGIVNPTYEFTKGNLQSMHIINVDSESHSKHNFNIDALNSHSRDLGYFESQTLTFVTDKTGTFEYYCTLHPEMKGNIVIE